MMQQDRTGRMAGSIPVWGEPTTATDKITHKFLSARQQTTPIPNSLALTDPTNSSEQPYGFGDLIDIINPLHHIPVVGSIYRGLTGDQINPASRVMGGAVFGGALGAASGLVNVIAEAETGKDIPENIIALATPSATNKTTGLSAGEPTSETTEDTAFTVLIDKILTPQAMNDKAGSKNVAALYQKMQHYNT